MKRILTIAAALVLGISALAQNYDVPEGSNGIQLLVESTDRAAIMQTIIAAATELAILPELVDPQNLFVTFRPKAALGLYFVRTTIALTSLDGATAVTVRGIMYQGNAYYDEAAARGGKNTIHRQCFNWMLNFAEKIPHYALTFVQ